MTIMNLLRTFLNKYCIWVAKPCSVVVYPVALTAPITSLRK